jgi:holliday junction DNA helicase RuvA
MIYSITGQVESILDHSIIINTQGIGYEVFVSELVISKAPKVGHPLTVYTYHHVREDLQVLYGFSSLEDKNFFTILTSVSGVGPKVAIRILSSETESIVQAIMQENIASLTSIQGVGKKMAERMIVELKDKLSKIYDNIPHPAGKETPQNTNKETMNDTILALKTLGYKNDEIKRAIALANDQLKETTHLESKIKVLLKHL